MAESQAPEPIKRIIFELVQDSELWDKIESHVVCGGKFNVTFCFLGANMVKILVQDVF